MTKRGMKPFDSVGNHASFHSDAEKGDEQGVIQSLRTIAQTNDYILDNGIIDILSRFCVLFLLLLLLTPSHPSWELTPMRVTRNTCSICHSPMPKHRLSETNRSRLLHSIDLMAPFLFLFTPDTSFSRGQQFDAFKQLLTSLPPFDVVVDGANVGFTNANFDLKHGGELKLNTRNIESMVDALDARNLHPLVILHRYHLRHMKEPQSLATMEVRITASSSLDPSETTTTGLREGRKQRRLVLASCGVDESFENGRRGEGMGGSSSQTIGCETICSMQKRKKLRSACFEKSGRFDTPSLLSTTECPSTSPWDTLFVYK